jgi:hypothetical protein
MLTQEQKREQLHGYAARMVDELWEWSGAHPEATLEELEAQVRLKRRELLGEVLPVLLTQHGTGYAWDGQVCPDCGQAMIYKGSPGVTVESCEASAWLERAYYYCPACERGLFPPG